MTLEELTRPLDLLEKQEHLNRNDEIVALFGKVRGTCVDLSNAKNIIFELEQKIKADRHDTNKPYYYILLAYAKYFDAETGDAIEHVEKSANHFDRQDKKWQHAISSWLWGIFLYKQGDIDRGKSVMHHAVRSLEWLDQEDRRQGEYSRKYEKEIKEARTSEEKMLAWLNASGSVWEKETFSHETFSELIRKMRIPNNLDIFKDLQKRISDLPLSDLAEVNNAISMLTNDKSSLDPYTYAFLAHCFNLRAYTREEQYQQALQHNWNAIKGFGDGDARLDACLKDYNKALSHWYRGMLYYIRGDKDSFHIHLEKAKFLLLELNNKHIHEFQLDDLLKKIGLYLPVGQEISKPEQGFFHNLFKPKNDPAPKAAPPSKAQTPELRAPQPTEFPEIQVIKKKKEGEPPGQEEPPRGDLNTMAPDRSRRRHIIIPVDVDAIREMNIDSLPLEPDMFEKLGSYDIEKENHNGSRHETGENHTFSKPNTIPSLSLYGVATAGPSGEPVLPDPSGLEKIPEVDPTRPFIFDGKQYKVEFLDRSRVGIPARDASLYGWLKVVGYSMNKADPLPINNEDMILFVINYDLEACLWRIVVACPPDMVTQPPRLMVKRLEKLDLGDAHTRKPKFILTCESTYERDPRTGVNFMLPIQVTNDNQVVGTVLAVAKPV